MYILTSVDCFINLTKVMTVSENNDITFLPWTSVIEPKQ